MLLSEEAGGGAIQLDIVQNVPFFPPHDRSQDLQDMAASGLAEQVRMLERMDRAEVEKAIEQGGLQPGEVSLLIQADKAVRHEVIIDLCTMAGKIGIGRVLLASRPPDFVRPFDPELKTEP